MSWWSPPVLHRGSCWALLGIVSSGIRTMCPNSNKRHAWTTAKTCSCMVVHLTSSFHTWWFHLIPNSFRRHHWLTASILCTNLLLTIQHSEPYRKMGRCKYYSASVWWRWRCLTSRSDCLVLHICMSDGIVMWDIRTALNCTVDKGAKVDKLFNNCNLLPLKCDCRWLILPAAQSMLDLTVQIWGNKCP